VKGAVFPSSIMQGFDKAHGISDVTLSNFRIHGSVISHEEQLKLKKNEFVKGPRFEAESSATEPEAGVSGTSSSVTTRPEPSYNSLGNGLCHPGTGRV